MKKFSPLIALLWIFTACGDVNGPQEPCKQNPRTTTVAVADTTIKVTMYTCPGRWEERGR